MSRRYIDMMGEASPSARGASRVADIVAALTPPAKDGGSSPTAIVKAEPKRSYTQAAMAMAPGVACGVAGAYAWKRHRVLGFLLGHAVGNEGYALLRGNPSDRKKALWCLGVEGAAVGGALAWKRHPVVGFFGAYVAAFAVSAFVPGTPIYDAKARGWR